jgi:ankyrin repeat protein
VEVREARRELVTALYYAAAYGQLELSQKLLALGAAAHVVYQCRDGSQGMDYTLVAAARGGYVDICCLLLQQWTINVETVRQALCAAAAAGHLPVVQQLVAGFPAGSRAGLRGNPLYAAAENGHLAVVDFFVQQGAYFDNVKGTPFSGSSPHNSWLEAAAAGGNLHLRW